MKLTSIKGVSLNDNKKFETFPDWKNKTIGWLRQVKQHAGEDLTESDIEEIYSEHFDGIFSSFNRI